jgi:hypothetical protein
VSATTAQRGESGNEATMCPAADPRRPTPRPRGFLTVDDEDRETTVRVYDGAHGTNDMRRHNRRGEKAPATAFHAGALGEGMRAAINAIRTDYKEMIGAWRAT